MESAFVLAERPPLEILIQVRNGLPAAMFEQVASTLGLSASVLAAKSGIARRMVTRKRGDRAPLSSETSEKILRVARAKWRICWARWLTATSSEVHEGIPHWRSALHTVPERGFQRKRRLVRFGPLAHSRPSGGLHSAISVACGPRDPGPPKANE